jgi:hypothetical protein
MPPDDELRAKLVHAGSSLAGAVDDLLEVHGIHPAVLSAVVSRRTRLPTVPVPVELTPHSRPAAGEVEVASTTSSEALTNIAKHAQALSCTSTRGRGSIVRVVRTTESAEQTGAGSGLIGPRLAEALNGKIEISSPAGRGTWLLVEIPVERTDWRRRTSRHALSLDHTAARIAATPVSR